MFRFHKKQNSSKNVEYILISNEDIGNIVKIYPSLGGSIQSLILKDKVIIKEDNSSDFKENFSSSILFPYANRVENGTFSFFDKQHRLPLNEVERKNAIHGLVYDKEFEVKEYCVSQKKASLTLSYSSTQTEESQLYNYRIDLNYKIDESSLSLHVNIKNTGKYSFPFSLGWHPYFYSKSLKSSHLNLESRRKIVFNSKMIPCSVDMAKTRHISIDRSFDDCYKLTKGMIKYHNKEYKLLLTSDSEVNYVQIFTPEAPDKIAIEFMTSPPNSLNTKKDILILDPKNTYDQTWSIHLT